MGRKDTENPIPVYFLDTQTSPIHIYSNKNNHHGGLDVMLHFQ